MTNAVLLDTNAALWLTADTLGFAAVGRLTEAALGDGIYVSPITAWEVGQLCQSPVKATALGLTGGPESWYRDLLSFADVRECILDGAIALASTTLPGNFHKDPADRFLVATARAQDFTLMTRDRKILAYAEAGHVKAIAC